jgi:ATP-dependent RNA helicase DeaD
LDEREMRKIASIYRIDFQQRAAPSDEDVANVVSERLVAQLEAKLRDRDKLQVERMQRFLPLAGQLAETEEGRALLAMLLDDSYHASAHKTDLIPAPEPRQTQQRAPRPANRDRGRDRGRRR